MPTGNDEICNLREEKRKRASRRKARECLLSMPQRRHLLLCGMLLSPCFAQDPIWHLLAFIKQGGGVGNASREATKIEALMNYFIEKT